MIIIKCFLNARDSAHVLSFSSYKPHHEIGVVILCLQRRKRSPHRFGTSRLLLPGLRGLALAVTEPRASLVSDGLAGLSMGRCTAECPSTETCLVFFLTIRLGGVFKGLFSEILRVSTILGVSPGVPSPLSKVEASGQWLERSLQGKEANNEVRQDCEVPAVDRLDPAGGPRGEGVPSSGRAGSSWRTQGRFWAVDQAGSSSRTQGGLPVAPSIK